MDSKEHIIKDAFIQFHNEMDVPFSLFNDYHFGIVNIEMASVEITNNPQHIFFSIDVSGSMNDICKDGRTKIYHVINATKNIMTLLSESNKTNISVEICGFDDNIHKILENTTVSRDNIHMIYNTINKIEPLSSTDIELALNNANDSIDTEKECQISHIFLTDGHSTSGSDNPKKLSELVNNKYKSVFIGFGSDHNSILLQKLASKKNGAYYFADQIENSGFIFGEILHSILYQSISNVIIDINDGEIYDYRTDTWNNTLRISSLLGEDKKIYHIRSKTPNSVRGIIFGKDVGHNNKDIRQLFHVNSIKKTRLDKYMFRQRVQEILFEANNFSCNDRRMDFDKKKDIKYKIKYFFELIKEHIDKNMLEDDVFYKTLADDLYITYKTFGKDNAGMYSGSRQHSQGCQTSYNISKIDHDNNSCLSFLTPMKRLNGNIFLQNFNNSDEDSDLDHTLDTTFLNETNTTPIQRKLMRFVSSGKDVDMEDDLKV
jgi:hypothetical protein